MKSIYLLIPNKISYESVIENILLDSDRVIDITFSGDGLSAAINVDGSLTDTLIIEELSEDEALDEWEDTYIVYKRLFRNPVCQKTLVLDVTYSCYHDSVNVILYELFKGLKSGGIDCYIDNGKDLQLSVKEYEEFFK